MKPSTLRIPPPWLLPSARMRCLSASIAVATPERSLYIPGGLGPIVRGRTCPRPGRCSDSGLDLERMFRYNTNKRAPWLPGAASRFTPRRGGRNGKRQAVGAPEQNAGVHSGVQRGERLTPFDPRDREGRGHFLHLGARVEPESPRGGGIPGSGPERLARAPAHRPAIP